MLTRMFSNEEREYRPQIFKNQIKNEKGWGPFSPSACWRNESLSTHIFTTSHIDFQNGVQFIT